MNETIWTHSKRVTIPGMKDTSPEAERVFIAIYRRMSPQEKWRRLGDAFRFAETLVAADVRARKPDATAEDIRAAWLERTTSRQVYDLDLIPLGPPECSEILGHQPAVALVRLRLGAE